MNSISISVPVSDQLCADVLCTALEGGIGYWAEADDIVSGEGVYHRVTLTDAEGDDDWSHILDNDAIRRGIEQALHPDFAVDSAIRGAIFEGVVQNDAGYIDAIAADVIVQAACFGEIVYG